MQLTRGVREIRQVPRVLRKDYSAQRWWDGKGPVPKIDHTVSAVSLNFQDFWLIFYFVLQWGNGFMYQFIKPFAEPVPSVWTNQGDAPLKAGDQITGKIQNGFAKYGKFFELCSKKAVIRY